METKRIREIKNGVYMISQWGNIIRQAGYIKVGNHKRWVSSLLIKPRLNLGYYTFTFKIGGKNKTFRRGRLVAKYFVPNPKKKPYVNHKDGIKTNDFYLNLEWCTHQENVDHAKRTGLVGKIVMPKAGSSALAKPVGQYKDGKLVKKYDSIVTAANKTGFNKIGISKACTGHLKTYKKFTWQQLKNQKP